LKNATTPTAKRSTAFVPGNKVCKEFMNSVQMTYDRTYVHKEGSAKVKGHKYARAVDSEERKVVLNPLTNRKIDVGGKSYMQILALCDPREAAREKESPKKRAQAKTPRVSRKKSPKEKAEAAKERLEEEEARAGPIRKEEEVQRPKTKTPPVKTQVKSPRSIFKAELSEKKVAKKIYNDYIMKYVKTKEDADDMLRIMKSVDKAPSDMSASARETLLNIYGISVEKLAEKYELIKV
jgi:ATPase subunit of ABC transporter with duplicated ATPase domains